MLDSSSVKARARELGFDLCGIAPVDAFPELAFLGEWLSRGYAGHMGYLPRTAARRRDVRHVLPSARSVIATGTLYNADRPSSLERTDAGEAVVSRYAWGRDYHDVLARRLDDLLSWMRSEHGEPFDARACVDTGPVQERVYAQRAGLGWIGKNTCLINPGIGSWLFLAEIVCSLPLEPDTPGLEQCGTCTLCLEACPTGALVEPGVLDARRCLSYLTIELKRGIPEDLRPALGTRIYGCDVCQDVCPYNHHAPTTAAPEWQPSPGLDGPRLAHLWRRTDDELASLVAGTAMTRPTLAALRRNVAVAIGNSADPDAVQALSAPSDDEARAFQSRQDPVVSEHVAWARRARPRATAPAGDDGSAARETVADTRQRP